MPTAYTHIAYIDFYPKQISFARTYIFTLIVRMGATPSVDELLNKKKKSDETLVINYYVYVTNDFIVAPSCECKCI